VFVIKYLHILKRVFLINLLFALSFIIHNIEEAIWLPNWSKHAKKYHKPVGFNEFIFAVLIITILGIVLTFLNFIWDNEIIKIIYFGYVGMMVLNAIFPHLIATIALKRYAPGLITSLLLNVPIGVYLLLNEIKKIEIIKLLISIALFSVLVIISLPLLFKIGKRIRMEK
jgi:hypothetical protein